MFTLGCAYALHTNGIRIFSYIFWFRLITLGLIFYFVGEYKKKEFYYYENLGISKFVLWSVTIALDVLLFIILLTLTHKLK